LIYDRGTAIKIEAEFQDEQGNYFDPTSPKITIADKTGDKKVDGADLQKSDLGKYYYIYQSSTDDVVGQYFVEITGQSGSYTARTKTGQFRLE